jgi:hypothetical protein
MTDPIGVDGGQGKHKRGLIAPRLKAEASGTTLRESPREAGKLAVRIFGGGLLCIWIMIGIEARAWSLDYGLIQMLAWTANRPFCYRVLAPAIIDVLARFIGQTPAIMLVQFAACVGLSVIVWELAALVRRRWLAWAVTLLGIVPLTWQTVQVYDMPVMALWALALLLMVRRQWAWLWPVFILACLAKETAALMVLVFAGVAWDRMERRRLFGIAGGLAAIWVVIRLGLMVIFVGHSGEDMQMNLVYQLRYLPIYAVFTMFIGLVLWRSWKAQPEVLQRAVLILPVFAGLYMVGGTVGEIRIFGELFPVLTLMLVQALPASRSLTVWAHGKGV